MGAIGGYSGYRLLRVFFPIFPAIFILLYNRCLEAVGTPTLDVHDTLGTFSGAATATSVRRSR